MKPFSRLSLAVFGFYFGLALLITFPLILNFSSQMIGHATGDTYEMGHHIWWFKYALTHGQPLFWQTLSGYPDGFSAVSLWSNPLQFFPAWLFALVMPVASAYNLAVLLAMALNGWAMCWVMWQRLADENTRICVPALVAGVIYMTFPTMQGHLFAGHAGLLVAWGAPLYIHALFKLAETPSRRWFALAVLFFLLTPSGHTLQLIYVLMPITGLFLLRQVVQRDWRGVGRTLLVSIIGSALLLIFVLPVFTDTFASDTYTGDTGYIAFSTDLLALVTPSFGHILFGNLEYTGRVLGVNLPEGYAYYGIAAAVLTIAAVWKRKEWRWWLLLAIVAAVLALGPVFKLFDSPLTTEIDNYSLTFTPPWAFLYKLPGFSLARTPGRFTFSLALAVAALAGYGAAAIWSKWGKRGGLVLALLAAFAVFEYQAFFPQYTVPANVPDTIQNLGDDVRAVMDMPWGNLLAAKQGMYLQTFHEHPLIAGQVTRRTPVSPAKLTLLEETLDLAFLDSAGVDVIILHKFYAESGLDQRLREKLGQPTYEDANFAVFDVPPPVQAPEMIWTLAETPTISSSAESYIYNPRPGWLDFSGEFNADGRTVSLYLDNRLIHQWTIDGRTAFSVPIPLIAADYHTLSLRVEPPCPLFYGETLECRALRVRDLQLLPLPDFAQFTPIQLGHGVTLAGAYPPTLVDDTLQLRLWWQFASPLREDDVRFIKVLDADGEQVASLDTAPNAEGEWVEQLDLLVADVPAGEYNVYAGWYSLPDVTRFPVLADTPGAQDGLIWLGSITIP